MTVFINVVSSMILLVAIVLMAFFVPRYLKHDLFTTPEDAVKRAQSKSVFASSTSMGIFYTILLSYVGTAGVNYVHYIQGAMSSSGLRLSIISIAVLSILLFLSSIFPIVRKSDGATIPAKRVSGSRYLVISQICFVVPLLIMAIM